MASAASLAAAIILLGASWPRTLQAQGTTSASESDTIRAFGGYRAFIKPSQDAVIGFSLPTSVVKLIAKGGQDVKRGDVLIQGDDAEDQALLKLQKVRAETDLPVRRAKAAADLAELEYTRMQNAARQEAAKQQEVDRARLAAEAATIDFQTAKMQQVQEVIQVERLQARVDRFRLVAPFDGQVDQIFVDLGQAVSENEKVIRVVNVDPLWIDVPASMKDVGTLKLKVGDPAYVLVEVAGEPVRRQGKVVEVSPVADPSSRTRRVRVEIANPKGDGRLVPGDPAWVRFEAK